MSASVRIIKLGGSLLEWRELVPAFRRWLSLQAQAANVVVVGGGPLVDALRQLNKQHALDDEAAHWLAVAAMSVTARYLCAMMADATLSSSLHDLNLSAADRVQILDVEQFLREDAAAAGSLPCSWQVTSDSIAARLAKVVGAVELVLLKSVTVAAHTRTLEAWSRSGVVDSFFARAAAGLRVRLVNLRDERFAEVSASAQI